MRNAVHGQFRGAGSVSDERAHEYLRVEYFLDIMARLQERGQDIAGEPVTVRMVHNVLTVADEITAEDLFDSWPGSSDSPDGYSFETLRVLNKEGTPAGVLGRIEAIVEANEIVCFQEYLHETANDDAATWDEYVNRGNARARLGRLAEALRDYGAAEAMAELSEDRDLVRHNKRNLLREIELN